MKSDKHDILFVLVIFIFTILSISMIFDYIKPSEKKYEFAVSGEIFKSKNCYLDEDIAYCEYEGSIIQADCYYLKEN